MKQPNNLPPGTTDRMIEDQQSNSRRGPKTKKSKGKTRYPKITFTMPPKVRDLIMAAKGSYKMSAIICYLLREGLSIQTGDMFTFDQIITIVKGLTKYPEIQDYTTLEDWIVEGDTDNMTMQEIADEWDDLQEMETDNQ